MASFNLLTEPWIPVIDKQGMINEYGIIDTLTKAHELSRICDPAPSVQFGVYRLLIAFTMDAYEIKELENIGDLINAGGFNRDILQNYTEKCGFDSFDLFNEGRPFYQSKEAKIKKKKNSVTELFCFVSPVNSDPFFTHLNIKEQAYSPAVCARGLVSAQVFAQANGRGHFACINRKLPWYVLVSGNNLFETLVLNCCGMYIPGSKSYGAPVWRSTQRNNKNKPSILEGFTWQPQAFYLYYGEGGKCTFSGITSPVLVKEIANASGIGEQTPKEMEWLDPNVAYEITSTGINPITPKEEREVWRDYGPFLLLKDEEFQTSDGKKKYQRPFVVDQFFALQSGRFINKRPLKIEIFGLRTKQAKVFEWQYETLSLPPKLEQHTHYGRKIQESLLLADTIADKISWFLKRKAYPRNGKSNKNAFKAQIIKALREFWAELQLYFYESYLPELEQQSFDNLEAQKLLDAQWKKVLRDLAIAIFERVTEPLDSDAKSLKRQVQARDGFERAINRVLSDQTEFHSKSKRKGGGTNAKT
ncbi:MAG: type I-E CRISPR-associated protein Cse1/CasA [Bacillota bacterium]